MLVILDDVLIDIDPLPVATQVFTVQNKENHLTILADGVPIQAGVRWFSRSRTLNIDPRSGKYSGKGVARAIFMQKSLDYDVRP